MQETLYERIKELCKQKGVTIAKLESELGFGNASIKKWERISSPSVDKIIKVASYFGVTVDYLLGRTDIKSSASEILQDDDIISFQRARQKMPEKDKNKMMQMLKISFDYAFTDEEDNNS
ncbi:MAG: helix-turn-helix transcriptional regulator [Alphaproteobacteria bacterium]|nr:helix-turn-helix transcriptional regulator [Alphaproteobacteria bacterium]